MSAIDPESGSSRPVAERDDAKVGHLVSFPYDRMTVEAFRAHFPRARWDDVQRAWLVPGKTARRRVEKWLAKSEAAADAFADAKGRDAFAFAFDPIQSSYLELSKTDMLIRTPYSRTVVNELRDVPFARWDPDRRAWRVPFRSYEVLRDRCPAIEAAARRNEPEERRRRAEERKGTDEGKHQRRRSAEQRRHRYPLSIDNLPPLGRPVRIPYGIVVFTEITGEVVEPAMVTEFYSFVTDEHIWGLWRPATFEELVHAWPAKTVSDGEWWFPTIEELRPARRSAQKLENRRKAEPRSDL